MVSKRERERERETETAHTNLFCAYFYLTHTVAFDTDKEINTKGQH